MIREHGFKIIFWVYWTLYISVMCIMINKVVLPYSVVMTANMLSLAILTICPALIFATWLDDCNTKYLDSLIMAMIIRFMMIISSYWGFVDDFRSVLLWSGVLMVAYYPCKWFLTKGKNDYFKY